ncbi:MAG: 4-(cytidine 5'-diphospho)-2-C-methyl-D-erythritol kinase [Coriobacteriales bacterium]|jgi:4-diphosphocytidyl-2-C-methyl-D-erythritol kinase|nr:4-(cytidine 5'-diphospho)-2-C-methyl-D-erythritol kinase [Coriobacteriales bacterium]
MISTTLRAPAKLNLLLAVQSEVVGGKHLLTTVFVTIDLADVLTFSFDDSQPRALTLKMSGTSGVELPEIAPEDNIVYVAVETMERLSARRLEGQLHIHIEKHIPHQGGLAGGSTDAAATLRFIAGLWGMPLSDPLLATAAQKLGADVAFFLHGGCALMEGSGEKLVRRLPMPALDIVLVKPPGGVATGEAYRAFDANPQPVPRAEHLVSLLEAPGASPKHLAAALENNLYPAACSLMPTLGALISEIMEEWGVCAALLAGSGSVVFGVCENAEAAARVAARFAEQGYWTKACKTA